MADIVTLTIVLLTGY